MSITTESGYPGLRVPRDQAKNKVAIYIPGIQHYCCIIPTLEHIGLTPEEREQKLSLTIERNTIVHHYVHDLYPS